MTRSPQAFADENEYEHLSWPPVPSRDHQPRRVLVAEILLELPRYRGTPGEAGYCRHLRDRIHLLVQKRRNAHAAKRFFRFLRDRSLDEWSAATAG